MIQNLAIVVALVVSSGALAQVVASGNSTSQMESNGDHAPVPTAPTDPSSPVGCLGNPLTSCLTYLQRGFDVSPETQANIKTQLQSNDAIDVNGKPVYGNNERELKITGRLRGVGTGLGRSQVLTVNYSAGKIVSKADVTLPDDPSRAETEEQYRETGVYEAFLLLTGSSCPKIERLEFYRFFQNTVKPKITSRRGYSDVSWNHAEESSIVQSPKIDYCGRKLSFTKIYNHDTDDISIDNQDGFTYSFTLSFK